MPAKSKKPVAGKNGIRLPTGCVVTNVGMYLAERWEHAFALLVTNSDPL